MRAQRSLHAVRRPRLEPQNAECGEAQKQRSWFSAYLILKPLSTVVLRFPTHRDQEESEVSAPVRAGVISIAERMRSLQNAGLAVSTTKRLSREVTTAAPGAPPSRSNRISLQNLSSLPSSSFAGLASLTMASSLLAAASLHTLVPVSRFGPSSVHIIVSAAVPSKPVRLYDSVPVHQQTGRGGQAQASVCSHRSSRQLDEAIANIDESRAIVAAVRSPRAVSRVVDGPWPPIVERTDPSYNRHVCESPCLACTPPSVSDGSS